MTTAARTLVRLTAVLALAGCGAASATDVPPVAAPSSPVPAAPTASTAPAAPSTAASVAAPSTTASPSSAPLAPTVVTPALITPTPIPSVRPGVYALGDSVMLGSATLLRARHYYVNAKVSRQFGAAVGIVRTLASAKGLPRNVVVHLGTNGTIRGVDCDRVVAAAGLHRRVFLVNLNVPRSWTRGDNIALARCVARHRANTVLIDWARASARHRDWFGPDRVHPNARGRLHYVALISGVVTRYHL